MPFKRKYSDEKLSNAMHLILDQNMSPKEAATLIGIHIRTIQRYKKKYVDKKQPAKKEKSEETDVVLCMDTTAPNVETQKVDHALIERAKFLDDLFEAKKIILQSILRLGEKSQNLDALQKTLKTLTDLENEGESPPPQSEKHDGTINMFNFFNQQLIQEGYEGPKLSPADIIKED